MSKESENWFKDICKEIPLRARIETMIDMELHLLNIENHYDKAVEITDEIFKDIKQYKEDFGIDHNVKCDYFKPYSKSCRTLNFRCPVIDGKFCKDRCYTEENYPDVNPISEEEWEEKMKQYRNKFAVIYKDGKFISPDKLDEMEKKDKK